MPRAAQFVAALACTTALFAGQAVRAADACAGGVVVPTHRVAAFQSWPSGTARPVAILTALFPASGSATTVVLDGILLPSKADEATRIGFSGLTAGLEGTEVAIMPSTDETDRHRRQHGTLRLADGSNLGERLLASGFGFADVSFAPCAPRFLAAETAARTENRGIWRQRRLWTDLNVAATGLPDFVLGRGRVASIGQSGHTTYINFGGNFRTDATVRLREALTSALTAAGLPPDRLSGRRVEVRGWASRRDGLDLELDSPLALRLQDGASDTGTD